MSAQPSKRLDWRGQTAVVMASGPSLTDDHIARACGMAKVIAVNTTMFGTFCDVGYSGDLLWWKAHQESMRNRNGAPPGGLWTCDRSSAERWGLSWVRQCNRPGLGLDMIHTNGNSGAQAVNLAFLFGARRILLLGFDMKLGPKGERHHHPDHPSPCVQTQLFAEWIHKFGPLAKDLEAAGCEVINCTPGSALPWFPMAKLEDVLP